MILVDTDISSDRGMRAINNNEITRETTVIGLGDMMISNDPYQVLTCIGIGSCIALCAYDPVAKLGGMAHVVLPSTRTGKNARPSAKYADSAVPMLLKDMFQQGAAAYRLVIKAAGGAHMLSIPGEKAILNIGARNINAINEALTKENMSISGSALGGTRGRSVRFHIDSGRVLVQTIGENSVEL